MADDEKKIRTTELRVDNGDDGVSVDISIDPVMFAGGEDWFILEQEHAAIELSMSCLERLLVAAKRMAEERT